VALSFHVERTADVVEVVMRDSTGMLEKRVHVRDDGRLGVSYRWDPSAFAPDDCFTTELSVSRPIQLQLVPDVELWRHPIETIAKSERGFDRMLQGESVTVRWPMSAGGARVEVSVER
jgi:hypothetical protein